MAADCSRGLVHVLGVPPPPSVMSVDLATCLTLRQPLHPLLSPLRTTQGLWSSSALSPRSPSSPRSPTSPTASPSEPRNSLRRELGGLKKRVVFADAKGLALTAVRLFVPEPASLLFSSYLPSMAFRRIGAKQETPSRKQPHKLRLAFPQPSLDFKVFMYRQQDMSVQLESCSVSEYCLSGRVRVSHVSSEQTVHVRISFDSWKSHHDIPCTFLLTQRFGALDTGIYSFDLSLPLNLDPVDGIEFCICSESEAGEVSKWDDNRGQNYRIHVEKGETAKLDNSFGAGQIYRSHVEKDSNSDPAEKDPGSPKLSRYQRSYRLSQMTSADVQKYAHLTFLGTLPRLGRMCPVK